MASLGRLNIVDTSPIRLMTSVALFGTTLRRNTNYSTCSSSFRSMTIRWSFDEIISHLAPFIFIPHLWHVFSSCDVDRGSFSYIADRRMGSIRYLMAIDKLSWKWSLLSRLLNSFMTNMMEYDE